MAEVTPTDHPKSVCNRCEIEPFDDGFLLSLCFLKFSVRKGGAESYTNVSSSSSSYHLSKKNIYKTMNDVSWPSSSDIIDVNKLLWLGSG